MQVSIQTCTPDGHLHRVSYTRYRIHTVYSPDYKHSGARNMYRIGINIYEKRIVHQVGYLQELNRDARSTKHKILICIIGFGGLQVACWPLVPKFTGSNPAEAVGFLRAKKSSARIPSEGK